MTNKISLLVATLAMVGCANAALQDELDLGQGAMPGAREPGMAANPGEMTDLALLFDVLGKPEASMSACQVLQMTVSSEFATHAPMFRTPENDCTQGDDGILELSIAAHTQTVLQLIGPGFSPVLLQVTTAEGARAMRPVRLLSDAAIAAVYRRVGMPLDSAQTVVVETPADGASVELRVNGVGEGPAPVYLDAEGSLTEHATSVAGGWALFTGLPEGFHAVFMSHAELSCTPDPSASWPGESEASASVIAWRGPDRPALELNAITHTHAFDCR